MSDDIEIPCVELCDGWTVDDIITEEDCDDAFAYLTQAIATIENRIDELEVGGQRGTSVFARTKAALRWRKAAMQIVSIKRGRISRAEKLTRDATSERKIIEYVKAMHPEAFREAVEHATGSTAPVRSSVASLVEAAVRKAMADHEARHHAPKRVTA